jgi:hypothetical protein
MDIVDRPKEKQKEHGWIHVLWGAKELLRESGIT